MTFTYPMSLEEWVRLGLFDREKRIYEEHLNQGNFDNVVWFSYGPNDEEVCKKLQASGRLDSRIKAVGLPKWARGKYLRYFYSILIPFIHKDTCKKLFMIKSNQMQGARVAAAIGKKYNIPFVFRTGYTFSIFYKRRKENENGIKRLKAQYWLYTYAKQERKLYKECNLALVASEDDKKYVVDKYNIETDRISILTNYIDCDLFKAKKNFDERKNRFLFVGRLNEQKNLCNLVEAFKNMDIGLDLYGAGEMEEELKNMISEKDDIILKGKVSNDKLPDIYNDYRYFILPSLFEGMPKTLLEAMACGCICFGTDVEGIREVIDKNNGILLSSTNGIEMKEEIINALKEITERQVNQNIGHCAVQYIENKHALKNVIRRENDLMMSIFNI